jgi:PAS domain S-box-containing protein
MTIQIRILQQSPHGHAVFRWIKSRRGLSLISLTPFFDFVHPDDLDSTRGAVSALAAREKVYSFENRYRCKDGTYRWLQWHSTPIGDLIYAEARAVVQ